MTKKAAPRGLQARGRALWRAVVDTYELRADEEATLTAACRTVDELALLEDELANSTVVTAGSKGQDRPNLLFDEVRSHRATLLRCLDRLGLDVAEGNARSAAGRSLARQRWSRHGAA